MANNSTTIPGGAVIGTLKFGGTLTMNNTSVLNMQVVGSSAFCDKLVIAGKFTCNGTLNVAIPSGTSVAGDTYNLFTSSGIIGTFVSVNLPVLAQGLEWDVSELYTTGTIRVIVATGFNTPAIKTGVKQNPTTGLFQVYTDYPAVKLNVMVTNLQGKMIYQSNVTDRSAYFEVDLSGQPDGIYLLRIVSDKDCSNVLKLIKQ